MDFGEISGDCLLRKSRPAIVLSGTEYNESSPILTVAPMTRSLKVRGKSEAYENNVPIKKIGYVVSWGTAALLLLSFLLGSAHSMVINGVEYTDEFWLKTADMLIVSSLVLIVVAIGAMAYGATNFMRRDHVR